MTRSIDCGRFPGLVPGKRVCGPLRLPDVKPPCSNLAGTLVPAIFSFAGRRAIRRSSQSSRQQVKQAPDQTADQCSVYADVLKVAADNEFNPVREAAGVPLAHDLDKELCQAATPGHDFQC